MLISDTTKPVKEGLKEELNRLAYQYKTTKSLDIFTTLQTLGNTLIYKKCNSILNNSYDAEEATADTWIYIYNNIDKFRFDCKFTSWVYYIASSKSRMLLRKLKKDSILVSDDILKYIPDTKQQDRVENIDYLKSLLKALNREDLKFLMDMYVEEYDRDVIASYYNTSYNTIKLKSYRLRKKILAEI